jgi:hypothetical protein
LELVPIEYFCYEYSSILMSELKNPNERTSVSIPRDVILEIDRRRGDVSRSRFFLRMIEKSYGDCLDNNDLHTVNKKNARDAVDERSEISESTVSHWTISD